jgi:hypothetical protein
VNRKISELFSNALAFQGFLVLTRKRSGLHQNPCNCPRFYEQKNGKKPKTTLCWCQKAITRITSTLAHKLLNEYATG